MPERPLRATARLLGSGVLQCLLVFVFMATARDLRWCIVQGSISAAAILLVIPVLTRGGSWQKMLAGLLLFFPLFNFAIAVLGVVENR
jgi:hypothetical protein